MDEEDLFLAIPKYGNGEKFEMADYIKHLLDAVSTGTAKNKCGETPLMVAAVKGFVRSSRLLMAAKGVDLKETDARNRTVLAVAKKSARCNDDQQVNKPW